VVVKHENNATLDGEWHGRSHQEEMDLKYLLSHGSGGATCSLVFRASAIKALPLWYSQTKGGDWSLQILCASNGKMRYFRDTMGVYRQHAQGATYYCKLAAKARGEDLMAIPTRNVLAICDVIDEHFSYSYTHLINRQRAYWCREGALEYSASNPVKAFQYFYKAFSYLPCSECRKILRFGNIRRILFGYWIAKARVLIKHLK